MYSNYPGLKVRNSIMKMPAPYPRENSVETLRVLLNDFDVREVLFSSIKSKTDICPFLVGAFSLKEKNPTITVASFFFFFFPQTTELIAYVPLFTETDKLTQAKFD